jgi:hypothetical protein
VDFHAFSLGKWLIRFKNSYDLSYDLIKECQAVSSFSVLIIDTEKPPWVLTRYRYNQNLIEGLTNPGLFKTRRVTSRLLSTGIGWLTWDQPRKILEMTKGHFRTEAERKFVEDLIVYLEYKIREAERIRTERKQLSFW